MVDRRTTEDCYTISPHCEPYSCGEVKSRKVSIVTIKHIFSFSFISHSFGKFVITYTEGTQELVTLDNKIKPVLNTVGFSYTLYLHKSSNIYALQKL